MNKIGILGGGQLGKMLCQAGAKWHLDLHILEKDNKCPANNYCSGFQSGDFNSYEDVLSFGSSVNILSVEIEHVNTEALKILKENGVIVHPHPEALEIIKDKGLQKRFYRDNNLPHVPFRIMENEMDIKKALGDRIIHFPFVQKARTAGYDGRGVSVVRNESDLNKVMDVPSIIEEFIPFDKELSVVVAANEKGEIECFPPVELVFHPSANLVEYLVSPARIGSHITEKAISLAKETISKFRIQGLLAVEMFLLKDGSLLINEVAPRPHNSGHHTIESCRTSQFEQHLRAIQNWPLGDPSLHTPAVMINLLGSEGYYGPAVYTNLESVMSMRNVHIHIYGKKETKPFRKMGHVTILDNDLDLALNKGMQIKKLLQVVSHKQLTDQI